MQWNMLRRGAPSSATARRRCTTRCGSYFVHSLRRCDGAGTPPRCEYGGEVDGRRRARQRSGPPQFHPEKSRHDGLALLPTFVAAAADTAREGLMELFPAIDVRDGRCVRLYQGDYAQQTAYDEDPVVTGPGLRGRRCPWIHVVDLDAARTGQPVNRGVIAEIACAVDVPVQTGGGVRDEAASRRCSKPG